MQARYIIEQIHEKFIASLQVTNHPKDMIFKPFLRFYVEQQLEKKHFSKSHCLSTGIAILTNQIKKKYASEFQHENNHHKRHNKYYLYGLRLPSNLEEQHEGYKSQYIENRKEKYRQASQEKNYESLVRKYFKKPQKQSTGIKRNPNNKKLRAQLALQESIYSKKAVFLDPEQKKRIHDASMQAFRNLDMNRSVEMEQWQEIQLRNSRERILESRVFWLQSKVDYLETKLIRLYNVNRWLMRQKDTNKSHQVQFLKKQM